MPILEAVEASLKDFYPKTHRQFVAFNIARKFNDTARLAKYLLVGDQHPKKLLLETARLARLQTTTDTDAAARFFDLLTEFGKERP